MRLSGRKATRQGRLNVATGVRVKGRLASGFCSPALIWAAAGMVAKTSSKPAFLKFRIMIGPRFSAATQGLYDAYFVRRAKGGAQFQDRAAIHENPDMPADPVLFIDHTEAKSWEGPVKIGKQLAQGGAMGGHLRSAGVGAQRTGDQHIHAGQPSSAASTA